MFDTKIAPLVAENRSVSKIASGCGWFIESTGEYYGCEPQVAHVACEAILDGEVTGGITYEISSGNPSVDVDATCDDCGKAFKFSWNLV